MKFIPTTLKPQEGQLVEARQAIVLDICRFYRVPPWMVGVLEKSSYASLEAQSVAFYQQTLQPWVVKLEQEWASKLLLESEKPTLEIRLNLDAFLRATTTERYAAYQQGRQGGWLSINDVRRKEGLPPIPGGDTYLSPLNMSPVGDGIASPRPEPSKDDSPPEGGSIASARSLIEDAARRVLTKESKALTRAAKKLAGPELRAWAETFYGQHVELVARSFAAPMRAAGLMLDPTDYAKRHCEQSIRSIASASDPLDVADEFIDIRPNDICTELLETKHAA
jgi:hypothetical protein